MDLLDATEAPATNPAATFLPAIAGLLVAGAVAAAFPLPPPHHALSWTEVVGIAVERVLAVSLACVVTVTALSAIRSGPSKIKLHHLAGRASLAAIWLAPLALLIRERSLWTIVIGGVFAVVVTQSFLTPQHGSHQAGSPEFNASLAPVSFQQSFQFRPLASACAALCVETGSLAVLAEHTLTGAVLVGIGCGVWAHHLPSHHRQDTPTAPRSRGLLIVGLAILFTIGGLLPYLPSMRSMGHFPRAHRRSSQASSRGGRPPQSRGTNPPELTDAGSEGHAGIILWPEKEVVTQLVVPPPALQTNQPARGRSVSPVVIPFNGVYWFFKAPDVQPPETSRQAHLSPDKVDIRSTDLRPLSIEAHDHLGNLIDLDCCSRIQIAIRNADRYPETVSLELVLVNTSLPGNPSQSLGSIMVKSTLAWKLYDKRPPVSETLTFAIPQSSALQRFDEVKIVFRLASLRADAGAKIAIDHLVLVPRGL